MYAKVESVVGKSSAFAGCHEDCRVSHLVHISACYVSASRLQFTAYDSSQEAASISLHQQEESTQSNNDRSRGTETQS